MHLNPKILSHFFRPAYFQRGQQYHENERVVELQPQHDGRMLKATVRGSGNHHYHLQIQLKGQGSKLTDIQGLCSCPVGHNCKHVVAALLSYIDSTATESSLPPQDRWLYKLKAARPEESQTTTASCELLLYVLQMKTDDAGSKLFVRTVKTRKLDDGSYASAKDHSVNPHARTRYMHEDDQYALLLLQSLKRGGISEYPELEGEAGARTLSVLIETGRCHWQDEWHPAMRLVDEIRSSLSWHVQADASQVIQADDLDASYVLLPVIPAHFLNTETGECGILDCSLPDKVASILLSSPAVKPEDVDRIRAFISGLNDANIPLPEKPVIHDIKNLRPIPCLKLTNDEDEFVYSPGQHEITGVAYLSFDYGGNRVHPNDENQSITRRGKDGFVRLHRNRRAEREALDYLDDIGLIADEFYELHEYGLLFEPVHAVNTWLDFMLHNRQQLEQQGWLVEVSEDFVFHLDESDTWYADVEEPAHDWFTLELGVNVDGEQINLLPFLVGYLENLREKQSISALKKLPDDHPLLMKQDNGRYLYIPLHKVRHIIDTLIELYDPNALNEYGRLQLSRYQGSQLTHLENQQPRIQWRGGESLRKLGEKLLDFKGVQVIEPPSTLKATLRDYQKEGLNWLQFLRQYDLAGVLADDMGLGKTVQALAHLLVEKQAGRADLPSLVVAPTSLMVNWKRESERFAPALKVLVLQGNERHQYFKRLTEYDIVLTTYPLLSRDTDVLLSQNWHIVILDEAQHIKNPRSKAAITARQLTARHRLCLTGTPMENHLGELWSQFHFLMPGLLGDEKYFRKLFRIPIEKQQDVNRQAQLNDRVLPFLLRREKSDVATELPPKSEIVSEVELNGAQRDLYETIRVSMNDKVRLAIDSKGIERSQIVILDALLKLRQVCCHPQLLKMDSAQKIKQSAKLNQLMEMLPEMVAEGRRILLFSQFTSMLAIIEQELEKAKIDYVKLTGKTRNRAQPIDAFQTGEVPVFLISLKAGGSGLNLTAADTVIHYDPWWNPAAENQATDRAHRIGQDKPVFVYKLISSGTVEEKIIDMQQHKQALADALFAGGGQSSAISPEDLQALFEPLE